MDPIPQYVVSTSGKVRLPAALRRRWQLEDGGPIEVLDLGFGALLVPAGTGLGLLDDLLPHEAHARFVQALSDDPDLATT